jgi:Fe2+ or Zn2+ uptake regulation protein
MSSPPAPEALRQRLLTALAAASDAMTTADLRRCVSTVFGEAVVHERIYHNLQILEKRGDVSRTTAGGRHTLWRLTGAKACSSPELTS